MTGSMNLNTEPNDDCKQHNEEQSKQRHEHFNNSIAAAASRLAIEQARLSAFIVWPM